MYLTQGANQKPKNPIKRWAWGLVGILAKLEILPETAPDTGHHRPLAIEDTHIAAAAHLLVVSAKRFHECTRYLKSAAKFAGYSLLFLPTAFYWRVRHWFLGVRQLQGRIWRSCIGVDSKPANPSNGNLKGSKS
jgi:hypothetical protein